MNKPISPDEVVSKKRESLPGEVIDAFNELIAENWSGYRSRVMQKEAVQLILKKLNNGVVSNKEKWTSEMLFKRHWLDVEDIYREAGWVVKYDKPGYNESYEAYFVFEKQSGRNKPMSGGYI